MNRYRHPCLILLGLLLATPSTGQAQDPWRVSAGTTFMFGGGRDLVDPCDSEHRLGVFGRIGRAIPGSRLSVESTLRYQRVPTLGRACDIIAPPRPDGTFVTEERPTPLLASQFTTADLRLRATLPSGGATSTFSVGGGHLWGEEGVRGVNGNRPFFVASAGLGFRLGARTRLTLEGEYLLLRSAGQYQSTTWSGGQSTSTEVVGEFREWLGAGGVTLGVVMRF